MNSLRLFSLGRALLSFGYTVATAITLVVVAPAADPAATLLAQTCKPQIRDPECAPLRNPTAAVSPHVDTTTSPTARVTYNVSDAVIISTSSFTFKNNGTSVYAPISWVGRSGSGWTDVALASGTNTIVAYVCNSQSLCAADTARIVFNPPTTQSAPTFTVSGVAPLHHNGFRPASPCPGCVTTLGYATPSYTSLDASRSLAIGYSSTTAAPMGYVMLRVMQTTPDTVKSYSLKLFTTDGYNTQVTLEVA